ncbi:MAG: SseB family protein, partial [Parasporobacterium sp.]|nr:SseB family protein [Parasporobacterium sp.]
MAAPINKNKMAVIKKLMAMDKLMAVFCMGTNMPLVECNPETFNDQVFVFESEELMKEFAA